MTPNNFINHNQNKLKDFRLSLKSQSIQSHEREDETIKINKYFKSINKIIIYTSSIIIYINFSSLLLDLLNLHQTTLSIISNMWVGFVLMNLKYRYSSIDIHRDILPKTVYISNEFKV